VPLAVCAVFSYVETRRHGLASMSKRLIVGISGASGAMLAVRFVSLAANHPDVSELHVVVTNNALRVASDELEPPASTPAALMGAANLTPELRRKVVLHSDGDIAASIASGSFTTAGMVVIPCSSGMLAAVAHGISRGLVQRAADLTLKERRPLVLALRETPFSLVHAENIVTATRAGAIVMPPIPAFYAGQSWDAYLDHFALRVLDRFGLDAGRDDLRWSGPTHRQK
jgi:polyprenyl P-hydroxybenzoate/phenylacrylic acid decarboxylase-like protein